MIDLHGHAFDGALVTGAISTPLWLSILDSYGQATLIVIAILLGILRIGIAVRELRRKPLPLIARAPLSMDDI